MPSTPISPLYARFLTSSEKRSLKLVAFDNVSSEINLIRVLNALLMQIQQSAPPGLDSRIQALRTCVILNHQLAYLVRWHDRACGPRFDLDAEIDAALALLAEEWKLA